MMHNAQALCYTVQDDFKFNSYFILALCVYHYAVCTRDAVKLPVEMATDAIYSSVDVVQTNIIVRSYKLPAYNHHN